MLTVRKHVRDKPIKELMNARLIITRETKIPMH